jgi:hypothetical protein
MEKKSQNTENEEVTTLTSDQKQNEKLSKAIMLSVDLESNFRLYSYRCISPQDFINRINMLIELYQVKND